MILLVLCFAFIIHISKVIVANMFSRKNSASAIFSISFVLFVDHFFAQFSELVL